MHETRYIAVPPRGILNSTAVTRMPFWSVNPYIGCEFGCAYCYARDTHRWTVDRALGSGTDAAREIATLPPPVAFERRIIVKEGAVELLARSLPKAKLAGCRVMFGTATDPYQPAERRFELTRRLLEVFLGHAGLRVGVITKSALIIRDAELLARIAQRHDVSVSISLASADKALLRRIEPRTPVPAARLRAMRVLADHGIRVGLLAAPILPGLTDDSAGLLALLRAAKDSGARWSRFGSLRMGPATRATFIPWLDRHRPDLATRYRRHFGSGTMVSRRYEQALTARFEALSHEAGIPEDSISSGVGEQVELWGDGAGTTFAARRPRSP
jgi:DNA repair photolyase